MSFFEQNGSGQTLAGGSAARIPVPSATTLDHIELVITSDLGAGTLQPGYRIDGGPLVTVGPPAAPGNVLGWFARQAKAGIVTANEGGSSPVTVIYDSFRIDPA